MGTATDVAKRIYEAFGRGDIPAILDSIAENVDWEFAGPTALAYAGRRRNHQGVEDFFTQVAAADDIHVFEPREFIEDGEHLTVLGWESSTARDTGTRFETEWVHVFTVSDGRVTRWRGFFNTAARYGN